jgi:Spy/CpxP family protein refolding chaperone
MTISKNNRWLTIATIILLVANTVTLSLLWVNRKNAGIDRGAPHNPPAVFEFLTKELQLDSKQQDAYRLLRDEHQQSQRQLHDSIRNAKDAFFSLLQQPNVPDSLLQDYSKKTNAYEQQMDIITFRHFEKVRSLCNPDQQKKFDALIKEVMQRMAGPAAHPPGPDGMRPPPPGL